MNNNENLQSPEEENQAARDLKKNKKQPAAPSSKENYFEETDEKKIKRLMYEKSMEQKRAEIAKAETKAKFAELEKWWGGPKGIKSATAHALKGAWGWIFICTSSVVGALLALLGLIYVNFHFFAKYVAGSDLFCDFGEELKVGPMSNARSEGLKWGEIIIMSLLDIFVIFLILLTLMPFFVIIILISNPMLLLEILGQFQ